METKQIHVQHYYSINSGATPTTDKLYLGELAVNAAYGSEALFIKNQKDENLPVIDPYDPYGQAIIGYEQVISHDIVTFKPSKYFEDIIVENEAVTAASLISLDKRLIDIENIIDSLDKRLNDIESIVNSYISVISCGTF